VESIYGSLQLDEIVWGGGAHQGGDIGVCWGLNKF